MTDEIVTYSIMVVRGCDFQQTFNAADSGDRHAKQFMHGFVQWHEQVDAARGLVKPACFSCNEPVTPKNFGGLACGRREPPSHDEPYGYAAAFCSKCMPKGPQELADDFGNSLPGAKVVTLH